MWFGSSVIYDTWLAIRTNSRTIQNDEAPTVLSKKNKKMKDKIKGLIFGQAIGDALGLGTEFMQKTDIAKHYPDGYYSYDQILQDRHRSRWEKGDWTDDTEQFLCIFDSILTHEKVDLSDIAQRFYDWFEGTPTGIGSTTYAVLSLPQYTLYPTKAAEIVWTMRKKNAAPNGGLMRNSIVGVWNYKEINRVLENAEEICALTHYDQRCKDSCKVMSAIISLELQGQAEIMRWIEEYMATLDERLLAYLEPYKNAPIEALALSDEKTMGYTLKALAAGLWAYENADSFSQGLLKVINEGGDADSNGCIAGALLGVKFGFKSIPKYWVNNLNKKEELEERVKRLLNLL